MSATSTPPPGPLLPLYIDAVPRRSGDRILVVAGTASLEKMRDAFHAAALRGSGVADLTSATGDTIRVRVLRIAADPAHAVPDPVVPAAGGGAPDVG